jgi:hypothetical protein
MKITDITPRPEAQQFTIEVNRDELKVLRHLIGVIEPGKLCETLGVETPRQVNKVLDPMYTEIVRMV